MSRLTRSSLRRFWRVLIPVLAMLILPLAGAVTFAQNPPVERAIEKAVESVGGADVLQGLSTLTTEASGVRWVLDEGFVPGGEAVRMGPFTAQVSYDVENGNLRVDHTREVAGSVREQAEIVVGAGGQAVADTIEVLGLDVSLIVGGHGGAISMEDFTGLLGQ